MFGFFPFCALIIFCIYFQASHETNCQYANFFACSHFASHTFSINFDASKITLFSKSIGLFGCCCNTLNTSLTCNTAPTPAQIGCLASVITTHIFIPNHLPTFSNFSFHSCASSIVFTFAVGHIGISINECVIPIAYFLAIIELTTFALSWIHNGDSTWISLSSAGAISKLHHHTRQQLFCFNNFSIHFLSKEISIKTFTHSQVAAGDVIAFEKFFGNLIPNDAIRGTIIIVVSFHETQPIQCLSATIVHFG
jgi:hypothetical protein